MTTEVTEKPDALAAAGASPKDTNDSEGLAGVPKLPVDNGNEPPAKDETFVQETAEDKAKKEADTKAAKEAEDKAAADKQAEIVKSYATMDDPAAQGAIEVLKEAGVPASEADGFFAKALATGDLSDIDWKAVEARIGKAKTFLVRSGVEQYHGTMLAKVNATVENTHKVFGGKENFEAAKAWAQAREKTDPKFAQEVDEIRDLLNMGGKKADAGARELLRLYNTDAGTTSFNTKLVTGDTTGDVVGKPLSRADYVTELKAVHDKGGNPNLLAQLDARRRAGISAGI